MNKCGFFCIFLIVSLFYLIADAQSVPGNKLVILHTNDLHSRLNGFSPEAEYTPFILNDDHTRGGFARLATLIREERENSGNDLLVVDAGDFLMGTFFPALEESTGFQLSLMKKMGYDVVTLGNHEFDFGPEVLAKIIGKSAGNGSVPLMVASNLSFPGKESKGDSLKALFKREILRPYLIIERNGLKLGIIGIIGYSAISNAPLARPVRFEDPVKTAAKYAHLLKKKEKVDLVLCISHGGVRKDKNGNWTGEDVRLAQKVPDIDIIISGHTHTLLEKAIMVNNIPVVQAGSFGQGMGRLEIEFSKGKIIHVDSKVIPVTDAIAGDTIIQRQIIEQESKITGEILKPLNLAYSSVVAETSFPLICNEDTLLERSNLGPLISDAVYSYVNKFVRQGTDITLFPAGLIFDNILPGKTGKQSMADLFRVVPMGRGNNTIPGYPLARIYVTGKELKGILEILYLAPSHSKDNYIYFGGLRAICNPDKGLLRKITSISIGDPEKGFAPVDWSKHHKNLYSITADSYVLEFVSIIRKLSMHLVKVTLKNEKGEAISSINDAIIDADPETPGVQEVKEWMALLWFLRQQPDIDGNGIPDIPEAYRTAGPRLSRE